MYYIIVISAAKFKNIRSRKMWLSFYMFWYIVVGFVAVYKRLIFFLIRYGSCLYVVCRCALSRRYLHRAQRHTCQVSVRCLFL